MARICAQQEGMIWSATTSQIIGMNLSKLGSFFVSNPAISYPESSCNVFGLSSVGIVSGMSWKVREMSFTILHRDHNMITNKKRKGPSHLGWAGPHEETASNSNPSVDYRMNAQAHTLQGYNDTNIIISHSVITKNDTVNSEETNRNPVRSNMLEGEKGQKPGNLL